MKNLLAKYKHGWVLSYFIIYLIWFFYLESRNNVSHASIHIGLDNYIPFWEIFVIPYALWFLYVFATVVFLFLKSKEDFYKCCAFLFIGMTICLIIYTIWPNGQDLRLSVFPRDNLLTDIVRWFYQNDTSTNVCPSIHVFNSIGVHIAITHCDLLRRYKWLKAGSFVLMVLICLSTVFIKQHSALDGIMACVLALIMYLLVYKIDYVKIKQKWRVKEETC